MFKSDKSRIKKDTFMLYFLLILPLLTSCQYLPELGKDLESIATDTAIKVEISRETFKKETDLDITINVQNQHEKEK
jgi:hypothetical protein